MNVTPARWAPVSAAAAARVRAVPDESRQAAQAEVELTEMAKAPELQAASQLGLSASHSLSTWGARTAVRLAAIQLPAVHTAAEVAALGSQMLDVVPDGPDVSKVSTAAFDAVDAQGSCVASSLGRWAADHLGTWAGRRAVAHSMLAEIEQGHADARAVAHCLVGVLPTLSAQDATAVGHQYVQVASPQVSPEDARRLALFQQLVDGGALGTWDSRRDTMVALLASLDAAPPPLELLKTLASHASGDQGRQGALQVEAHWIGQAAGPLVASAMEEARQAVTVAGTWEGRNQMLQAALEVVPDLASDSWPLVHLLRAELGAPISDQEHCGVGEKLLTLYATHSAKPNDRQFAGDALQQVHGIGTWEGRWQFMQQALKKLGAVESSAAQVKKMVQAVASGSVRDGIVADGDEVTIGGVRIQTA